VARALGGTPQLMKAAMPAQLNVSAKPAEHRANAHQPLRRAVQKAVHRKPPAASQIASADLPPVLFPLLDERAVIVLTEVTTFQAPPRVVLAVSPNGQAVRQAARPPVIRATYAIVPTPNGWLIIQI
jgi:hypothetical protein